MTCTSRRRKLREETWRERPAHRLSELAVDDFGALGAAAHVGGDRVVRQGVVGALEGALEALAQRLLVVALDGELARDFPRRPPGAALREEPFGDLGKAAA